MVPEVSRSKSSSYGVAQEGKNAVSNIALNYLASLAIASAAFQMTRIYGSHTIHVCSGIAFALVCNALDRKAPAEESAVLSQKTLDQLARIIWASSLVLGSVLLGSMSADLSTGGKVLLAGIKDREALAICQGISSLSWNVGYIVPLTMLLLRASLPFADGHQGLLRRFEEAAPGHLLMEELLVQIRGFSQKLFFQNLSISMAADLLSYFIDFLPPIVQLAYLPAVFYSYDCFLQAQRDLMRLGLGFFGGVLQPALEGRADFEVFMDSWISFLDEEGKRRWFLAVQQSKVFSEEKLLEILKKSPQDFSWNFLALHLPEKMFREYIKPELDRFVEGAKNPLFVGASYQERIKEQILRLKDAAISVQKTKEKEEFDRIQKAARRLGERLEFSANLTTSFPKNPLPSPPYYDVNETLQKALPNKELLHSLRSQVLVPLESLSSKIAAGVGQESIMHVLTQELKITPENLQELGLALSIPAPELVKDLSKAVAARLRELGLVSRKDLESRSVSNFPKLVEVCKELEKEREEEESFQALSDEFYFDNIAFRILGRSLGIPSQALDESPIGATAERLCDRGLSNRKELKNKRILSRLANGEKPSQETVIQRIRDVCKKYEEENGIVSALEEVAAPPQGIDLTIFEEENGEPFPPDRIRLIFVRALKMVLIFTQISKSLTSTTLGFLVGMILPEGRFPYFEGNYWSLFNMSQLYDLDPSSFSLDDGVFALSRVINQVFQAVVYSVEYSPLGAGLLAGITHARIVRGIPNI